ncbi:hypothetical protein NLX86_19125 [Streptomyces sp. A3M-1-3]|uniref:hypothetical protein n=1 Tax=Streptomyces sp. A3M-1-3 TaxID=2962044 RepID=UPI0020B75417|nr:hypothetical protein [Streptomyces sp. A3M-1-3]MCP3820132.1 hypothetical protein [Streptomyces sp. A3M-1-3]
MTRNDLANTPTETPPAIDAALIERLTVAVEALARQTRVIDPELKCYPPDEAARLLGKTENWVVEAIQARRIPFTYVGKSPRMTAAHIRWVQASGELTPHKYAAAVAA